MGPLDAHQGALVNSSGNLVGAMVLWHTASAWYSPLPLGEELATCEELAVQIAPFHAHVDRLDMTAIQWLRDSEKDELRFV